MSKIVTPILLFMATPLIALAQDSESWVQIIKVIRPNGLNICFDFWPSPRDLNFTSKEECDGHSYDLMNPHAVIDDTEMDRTIYCLKLTAEDNSPQKLIDRKKKTYNDFHLCPKDKSKKPKHFEFMVRKKEDPKRKNSPPPKIGN